MFITPPHGRIVHSDFATGTDGWSVVGNGRAASEKPAGGILWEPYGRGALNRYVVSTDAEILTDSRSDEDQARWHFVAPPLFHGNHVGAYGGVLTLTLGSSAGDFSMTMRHTRDARLVTLLCATCAVGRGTRLAIFAGSGPSGVEFDGQTRQLRIALRPDAWLKDPKNTLIPWTAVSECELVEVLSRLSGIEVLGDQTKGYESLAIDDVGLVRGSEVPLACADVYH